MLRAASALRCSAVQCHNGGSAAAVVTPVRGSDTKGRSVCEVQHVQVVAGGLRAPRAARAGLPAGWPRRCHAMPRDAMRVVASDVNSVFAPMAAASSRAAAQRRKLVAKPVAGSARAAPQVEWPASLASRPAGQSP